MLVLGLGLLGPHVIQRVSVVYNTEHVFVMHIVME